MEFENLLNPFLHHPELGEHGEAIDTNHAGATWTKGSQRQHVCPSPPPLEVEDVEVGTWELELVGHISGEAEVTIQPLLSCCLRGTWDKLLDWPAVRGEGEESR